MITGSSARSAMEISGLPAAGWPTGRTAKPQQQIRSELLFELADLAAEHRLCDVEAFRRPSEVELLGDGDEVAQLPQVQRGPGSRPMP
jgi:hypothetical protein